MSVLKQLQDIVGAAQVLTGEAMDPYVVDWRGRYRGQALAVVRPASTQEVADVVKVCVSNRTPIVPSGGNTSL
jgi:FAD/FMN-containing dehydrogenase